jgi:hypothetical protein
MPSLFLIAPHRQCEQERRGEKEREKDKDGGGPL